MTTPLRTSLLFDDPGELIASLPGILSFTPAESLLLVTYTGAARLCLESVLRLDLPDPADYAEVVTQLRLVARNHAATVIELVIVGGAGPPEPVDSVDPLALPHRALIARLEEAFRADGIIVAHAIWAPAVRAGLTWWCYQEAECTGQIRDPDLCPITTAATVAGAVRYASRDELAQLLAPDPPESLAHRAELLEGRPPADPEQAYTLVRDAVDHIAATSTDPDLDDPTIANLAHALGATAVREACLAFPLTVRAAPAERLWLALTRAAPGPTRAEPASLLATSTYLRGEGALAAVAVDAALSANPDHKLARTLRHYLDCGFTPDQFRLMLAQSFINAFAAPDPPPPGCAAPGGEAVTCA